MWRAPVTLVRGWRHPSRLGRQAAADGGTLRRSASRMARGARVPALSRNDRPCSLPARRRQRSALSSGICSAFRLCRTQRRSRCPRDRALVRLPPQSGEPSERKGGHHGGCHARSVFTGASLEPRAAPSLFRTRLRPSLSCGPAPGARKGPSAASAMPSPALSSTPRDAQGTAHQRQTRPMRDWCLIASNGPDRKATLTPGAEAKHCTAQRGAPEGTKRCTSGLPALHSGSAGLATMAPSGRFCGISAISTQHITC